MATATLDSIQKSDALDIFKRAICISLKLGLPGSRRKVSVESVEVDSDKERIGVSKSLLESPELKAIKQLHAEVRTYIYARSLPSMFRSGVYLIPNDLLPQVDTRLVDYKLALDGLVESFMTAYPTIKENDRVALRSNFDELNYPAPELVRATFQMAWSYVSYTTPESLPANIFTREQEKARESLKQATDTIQQVLRSEMAGLVGHITDRLTGDKDGKPKTFRNSLVENAKEFLDLFNSRNITDDAELEELCSRARGLLDGVDPQQLRDSSNLRENVVKGFAAIKESLDTMMVPKGTRAISFEEV